MSIAFSNLILLNFIYINNAFSYKYNNNLISKQNINHCYSKKKLTTIDNDHDNDNDNDNDHDNDNDDNHNNHKCNLENNDVIIEF